MRVTIPVEFEVESDEVEMTEKEAKVAASLAVEHYLSLCEISGYVTDTDEVTVFVDGFGDCTVSLVI